MRRAVDTNVIVRVLTADDPDQALAARHLVISNDIWVSCTVLIETAWVLRHSYGYRGTKLISALRGFLTLPTVTVETADICFTALDWAEAGLDLADALHLAKAVGAECNQFVTFDAKFRQRAQSLVPIEITSPPENT